VADKAAKGYVKTKMPWPKSIPRPTQVQVDVFWDRFEKQRREYINDPRTAPDEWGSDFDPAIQPAGFGLGGELANIKIVPQKTGIWKEMVRDWFKSLPEPHYEDKWTHIEPRLQSVLRQVKA
jgi:hypothetical protein